jgi:hypothetical protein
MMKEIFYLERARQTLTKLTVPDSFWRMPFIIQATEIDQVIQVCVLLIVGACSLNN